MLKLCLAIAAILDFLSTQKHKFCNEPLKAIPSYVYFQMIHWFQMGIIVKYFNNIKTVLQWWPSRSTKNTYKTKDRVTRTPLKPGENWGTPEG
jgi:hypothetical protein